MNGFHLLGDPHLFTIDVSMTLGFIERSFKMINSTTVEQVTSYTPVSSELEKRLDNLQKNGYHIINVIETKVNKMPGCSDQGFIILYDDRDNSSSVDYGRVLQQVMLLRKSVKADMSKFDSHSDAYKTLNYISDKLKGIINMGGMS